MCALYYYCYVHLGYMEYVSTTSIFVLFAFPEKKKRNEVTKQFLDIHQKKIIIFFEMWERERDHKCSSFFCVMAPSSSSSLASPPPPPPPPPRLPPFFLFLLLLLFLLLFLLLNACIFRKWFPFCTTRKHVRELSGAARWRCIFCKTRMELLLTSPSMPINKSYYSGRGGEEEGEWKLQLFPPVTALLLCCCTLLISNVLY